MLFGNHPPHHPRHPLTGSNQQLSFDLDHLPPKPQTLQYRWLNLRAPLWFKCSLSLQKSQYSIHLLGYTNVIPNGFAIQSCLAFSAPIRYHVTSLLLSTPLRIHFYCENLDFATFTVHLKSCVPTCIMTVSGLPRSLFSTTLFSCSVLIPGKYCTLVCSDCNVPYYWVTQH
jgi:hypothetical protein